VKRRFILSLTAALSAAVVFVAGYQGCGRMSETQHEESVAAVRAVLDAQVAAWNRGDIEGFMDGYAREEATTFVSGASITRGWQTVLERYRKTYDSREKMGTLAFDELDLKPLSEFYLLATGRWQLTLTGGEAPHGRFTLIFRRTVAGWRIVHDHTSSG
jgi:beta-aspartyl-peptidase (threonine type)